MKESPHSAHTLLVLLFIISLTGCAFSPEAENLKRPVMSGSLPVTCNPARYECQIQQPSLVDLRPGMSLADDPFKTPDISNLRGVHVAISRIMEVQRERAERMQEERFPVKVKPKIQRAQVVAYLKNAGFPAEAIPAMVCTANYESSFRPHVRNKNRNGSHDFGLFQINERWMRTCGADKYDLLNPEVNSRCAYRVWKEQGMQAWFGYTKRRKACEQYARDKNLRQLIASNSTSEKRN